MAIIPLRVLQLQEQGTHILVEVTLFDTVQIMVVDTGASKTVFDKNQLEKMFADHLTLESTDILSTGLGTNSMQSFLINIPVLKIHDWTIKNFKTAVLDLSSINYAYEQMNLSPVIGVIGGDILAPYGAVIDYKKRTLKILKRKLKLK
ncbi:retroviral-like aspartic protease family protein [Sphingobacterium sp. SRCM116780]|uniref:aspartyl protease family protein n=1 Tax=Sphingobacterium sp. SRCM116780 TaxID=2907623 RepID=UPI001F199B80|nr:aspartyl protease family protein [Sphingobacterium sp. SRCM116780]UIR54704.1 retroviral-like aspartic protease family protein [Sphingobacterium sp. SRCM116780]